MGAALVYRSWILVSIEFQFTNYLKDMKMNTFRLRLRRPVKSFTKDETGAVTVDWVVLTAALVGIALTLISTITAGIEEAATDIRNELTSALSG